MSTDSSPAGASRIRHLALQVTNLERSVAFYCDALGMQVLRRRANPIRRDIAAYVGYGPEDQGIAIELYQFVDEPALPPGEKPSHFAVAVFNIEAVAADILRAGGTIRVPPQHNRLGSINKFSFVRDPDGHEIELTENTVISQGEMGGTER